jgi:hypothetical protein
VALSFVRISFDLDDTLILLRLGVQRERGLIPWLPRSWLGEPLRCGTRSLFRQLRKRGFTIWVYTTSLRPPSSIRLWLLLHGLRIDGIVNGDRHRIALAGHRFAHRPSKYPPEFEIDLYVDDSEGAGMEGEELGFRVLVVNPFDDRWVEKVIAAAEDLPARPSGTARPTQGLR